jgi:hypothetical protein
MEARTGAPADVARWVADRAERLSQLTPDDGQAFDLSPAEAQRLIAYAGFSLFRARRAIEDEKRLAVRPARRARPAEVAV